MKSDQILKKQIKFYLEEAEDPSEVEREKRDRITEKINSGGQATLINELVYAIGNYLLSPAHNLVLRGKTNEGWGKFRQALFWLYHFIKRAKPGSVFLKDEAFATVTGIGWLFGVREIADTAIQLLKKKWDVKKDAPHEYICHKEFLISLYEIHFSNNQKGLAIDHLDDKHIYKRLIKGIDLPNDQYIQLINEACDYHLLHTPLMGNKMLNIEFTYYELVPYEILCLLKTREKLGFSDPVVAHGLMMTPLARLEDTKNDYDPQNDELLNLILTNAK